MTWFVFVLFFNEALQPRVVWVAEHGDRQACMADAERHRTGYDNAASAWCEAELGAPNFRAFRPGKKHG
jgi:hypothetical protein